MQSGLQTERVTHHATERSSVAAGGRSSKLGAEPDCSSTAGLRRPVHPHHLVHAGFITASGLGLIGQRVTAALTHARHVALDGATPSRLTPSHPARRRHPTECGVSI